MPPGGLQDLLTGMQRNGYMSAALITAVGYDYVLTFPEEVEYIWSKPWTWVSTLFIPVRYFGLFNLVVSALDESNFLPGGAKTYVFVLRSFSGFPYTTDIYRTVVSTNPKLFFSVYRCFQGHIIGVISGWTFLLFFGAAGFVMILRVWAMYNQSKLIIVTLLALFSVVIISTFLSIAINSIPRNLPAEIVQVLSFSHCCILGSTVPTWTNVAVILQITQSGVVCTLAIVQVMKQSLQMYRATKGWQLNRYMGLIAKQGLLFFLAIFLFNLVTMLSAFGIAPPPGWRMLPLIALEYVPIYTLAPRFILCMREIYARDTQGGYEGGIDAGFGLPSAGRVTTMVFADVSQDGELEDVDEILTEDEAE